MFQADVQYMKAALVEAQKAFLIDEVPIGAVVVHNGDIIGRGHNLREHLNDGVAHAEIMAIEEACGALNSWRLVDCDLYVTIEPCLMCSGRSSILESIMSVLVLVIPRPELLEACIRFWKIHA